MAKKSRLASWAPEALSFALWGAVFIDAGNASDSWRSMRPVYGVGPGIRWRSPVGALRVDFPYAVEDRRWRVEISLGIAP